ncbi:MAG: DUF3187 family protein [Deltaproteobacteria bacterium]|nr:DUF3187 family protein [Deltaproteobacteria bacterium]
MRRTVLSILFLTVITAGNALAAYEFNGPLEARNEFPFFLAVFSPSLDSAKPETSFTTSLTHSSVFFIKSGKDISLWYDMEVTDLRFRSKRVIFDTLELGLELPFYLFSSGFMDGPLGSYHDAFGFDDYGRGRRPANSFLYEVRKNGRSVVNGEDGRFKQGDLRLAIKNAFVDTSTLTLSLKADMELPTGDARSGAGNGSIDTALSALLDATLSERVKLYLNAGVVFPGALSGHDKIYLKDYLYGNCSVEALYSEEVSFLAGVMAQEWPFDDKGDKAFRRSPIVLILGGRYSAKKGVFELSFSEDLNTTGGPDFSVGLAYKRRF